MNNNKRCFSSRLLVEMKNIGCGRSGYKLITDKGETFFASFYYCAKMIGDVEVTVQTENSQAEGGNYSPSDEPFPCSSMDVDELYLKDEVDANSCLIHLSYRVRVEVHLE